jgi:anti-sigma B factor antagonist
MKEENFVITKDRVQGGIIRFSVKGRVNATNSPVLKNKLEEAINDEHINIFLNMSQVDYLSSIGISAILSVYKRIEEVGGNFGIEQPSEVVRNVLGITALERMLVV